MVVPHPDAVITMASRPWASISAVQASMLRFAKAWLSRSRPRWCTRAPQHPSPFGCTTSIPCRLRSRIAASLKPGFSTGWAQPDRIATRPRRSPHVGRLDVASRMIDEVHVVDARRAGRHAREAGQAAVDMLHDLRSRGLSALQHVLDEVDAPARAVELVAEQQIGRAGRGTESAVDTGPENLLRTRHGGVLQLLGGEVRLHVGPLSFSARSASSGARGEGSRMGRSSRRYA